MYHATRRHMYHVESIPSPVGYATGVLHVTDTATPVADIVIHEGRLKAFVRLHGKHQPIMDEPTLHETAQDAIGQIERRVMDLWDFRCTDAPLLELLDGC